MPAPRRKRENEKNERPLPKKSKKRNEPEEKCVPLEKLLLTIDGKDDGDWKRPLFFWKGVLSTSKDNTITFKGSWVSGLASNGVPDESMYEETKETNYFTLECKNPSTFDTKGEAGGENLLSSFFGVKGEWKGSYLLDQCDGMGAQSYTDTKHFFAFDTKLRSINGNDVCLIAACGETEFGLFVAGGFAKISKHTEDATSKQFIELVLARRYIMDRDGRGKCAKSDSPVDLLNEIVKDTLIDDEYCWGRILPRKCGRGKLKL
ncbi:predicted protein [Chaetoceros tenuissimus]|uniref:Uncharacterized protein n=1 Tax=Chaetoceros tenuissimus TaxID=426638 RepID=A0AAD3D0Z9_9STRA|nr:predicted protein [Chaetoceros tenuissimus]